MFSCSSGASIVDCCFLLVLLVMNSADTWTFLSSIVLVFTLGKMCSIVGTLHSRSVVHFDIEESRQSNKSCPKWMGLQWQRELCEGMICSMDLTHRLTRCTCPWPIRTLRAGWHRDRSQSWTLLGWSTTMVLWRVWTLLQIKAPLKSHGHEHWIDWASLQFTASSLTDPRDAPLQSMSESFRVDYCTSGDNGTNRRWVECIDEIILQQWILWRLAYNSVLVTQPIILRRVYWVVMNEQLWHRSKSDTVHMWFLWRRELHRHQNCAWW